MRTFIAAFVVTAMFIAAPAAAQQDIIARDGDRIIVDEDARVEIVRRRQAAVRTIFNQQQRLLIVLVDYVKPGEFPDGTVDWAFNFYEVEGNWPLGERWEALTTLLQYDGTPSTSERTRPGNAAGTRAAFAKSADAAAGTSPVRTRCLVIPRSVRRRASRFVVRGSGNASVAGLFPQQSVRSDRKHADGGREFHERDGSRLPYRRNSRAEWRSAKNPQRRAELS